MLLLSLLVFTCGISTIAKSHEFLPGEVWRDTDGAIINAHGGGVLFYSGIYYLYGESKSGHTFLPDCNKSWGGTRVDTTGVSCYSSTNLCDWKNEGIALAAAPDDPQSDLHSSKVLERPKVIYNRATKQFVMWVHVDSTDYAAARSGVAVSDKPIGPFKYLGSFRPNAGVWPENVSDAEKTNVLARDFKDGQMARDMTVLVDDDGKAYQFYSSEENPTMHVSLLTADYLRPAGKYQRIFVGRSMEAPTVFKHAGKYYLIASGCSAWEPNAARSAVATNIFGPWTELGNPCVGINADKTFNSQSTFVIPVQGRADTFIFMADRWNQWNLPDSRYVWLPLEFSADGKPSLRWREQWSLDADSKSKLSSLKSQSKE
jgi:Glycosyl hydrolases family 43